MIYRIFNYARQGYMRSPVGFQKISPGHVDVLAYSDDKQTVTVAMPYDEVVDFGINPWQLDLFDADPIRLKVDGRVLNFRRLNDVTFAYRLDGMMFVGTHDGQSGTCFTGAPSYSKPGAFGLSEFKVSDRPFEEHMLEYLRCKDQMKMEHDFLPSLSLTKADVAYPMVSKNPLILRGRDLSFGTNYHSRWQQLNYCGEMFRHLDLPTPLPKPFNRAFALFPEGDPIVYGLGLYRALSLSPLLGRLLPWARLASFILKGKKDPIWNELNEKRVYVSLRESVFKTLFPGANRFPHTFVDNGITYECRHRVSELPAVELYRVTSKLSVHGVYSSRPNVVSGSRIALYDLSKRQFRPLESNNPTNSIHARSMWKVQ